MEYCSQCKNVTICRYTSETTNIKDKIEELKKEISSGVYTITFKCNYFEQSVATPRGFKMNEISTSPYVGSLTGTGKIDAVL